MKELVLVSGSGRGLGSSIAKSFAANGYKVAVNYFKSEEKAHKLCDELGNDTYAFSADVSNQTEVKKMISDINDKFNQSPSILVNNAMTEYVFNGDARKFADEISWEEISNHLDVTLKGSLNLIQALIPSMKKNSHQQFS